LYHQFFWLAISLILLVKSICLILKSLLVIVKSPFLMVQSFLMVQPTIWRFQQPMSLRHPHLRLTCQGRNWDGTCVAKPADGLRYMRHNQEQMGYIGVYRQR
jgi:hypothetical protein